MGRFRADEVDNYGGTGGAGFFQLKNDGDIARVRIMYDGIEDVEGYAVHEVKVGIDDRSHKPIMKYVNCLRDYKDPVDVCPLCREGYHTVAKLFIPLYNLDENKVQLWERGKTFFKIISSKCSRYPHLVGYTFEIERHGAKGDQATRYEIIEVADDDGTNVSDLPPIQDPLGGLILDKTAEDMEYFLQEKQFPPTDGDNADYEEEEMPVRRRSNRDRDEEPQPRNTGRRTPARRNNEDVY